MTRFIPAGSLKRDRAVLFGAELERALRARNVSVSKVANATGCSTSSLMNWRVGRILPRIDTVRMLSDALEWPRLEEMIVESRSRVCPICCLRFVDDSGSGNRVYCSLACRRTEAKKHVGVTTSRRAAVAERNLRAHRDAVAAMCAACEPSGRCVDAECPLRPASPFVLHLRPLSVVPAVPSLRNGYHAPSSEKQRKIWAGYTPGEREERLAKIADATRRARRKMA